MANSGLNEKTSNHAHRLSSITLSEDHGYYLNKMQVFFGTIFTRKLHHAFENTYEKCSCTIQVHVMSSHISVVHILLSHVDNPLNVQLIMKYSLCHVQL